MAGVGRIFLAVRPTDEARHGLAARLDAAFSEDQLPGRVVRPPSWHLTLRFLGDLGEEGLDRLLGALDQADLGDRFRLSLDGLGAFPRPGKAGVLWIGVDRGEPELVELQERTEEACDLAGLGREERPYVPHLTLSRIRPPVDVWRWFEQDPDLRVAWEVDSVDVMRSHRRNAGAEYELLERMAL